MSGTRQKNTDLTGSVSDSSTRQNYIRLPLYGKVEIALRYIHKEVSPWITAFVALAAYINGPAIANFLGAL